MTRRPRQPISGVRSASGPSAAINTTPPFFSRDAAFHIVAARTAGKVPVKASSRPPVGWYTAVNLIASAGIPACARIAAAPNNAPRCQVTMIDGWDGRRRSLSRAALQGSTSRASGASPCRLTSEKIVRFLKRSALIARAVACGSVAALALAAEKRSSISHDAGESSRRRWDTRPAVPAATNASLG